MSRDDAQFAARLEQEVQHRLEQLGRGDAGAVVEPMDARPVWITSATVVAIIVIFILTIL